jgi:hypothetical protein
VMPSRWKCRVWQIRGQIEAMQRYWKIRCVCLDLRRRQLSRISLKSDGTRRTVEFWSKQSKISGKWCDVDIGYQDTRNVVHAKTECCIAGEVMGNRKSGLVRNLRTFHVMNSRLGGIWALWCEKLRAFHTMENSSEL